MRPQTASRATRMFWKDPRIQILVSARTMRVRVVFSIVNFVFPPFPARRPMHLAKCSPRRVCGHGRGNGGKGQKAAGENGVGLSAAMGNDEISLLRQQRGEAGRKAAFPLDAAEGASIYAPYSSPVAMVAGKWISGGAGGPRVAAMERDGMG